MSMTSGCSLPLGCDAHIITHPGSSGIAQAQYPSLAHMRHKILWVTHTEGVVEAAAGEGALITSGPSRRDVYLPRSQ